MILELKNNGLPPRLGYALVSGVIGFALFASATPSPLYGIYRQEWGFSPLVLTLVFSVYAFGVLAALLLAGRVSDEVGRRPVLIVALSTLIVTSVVFMLANSVVWLLVGRGIQGLATGLAIAAASAAMLDLHTRRDPAGVGLTNGVVSAGGLGTGVLVSALLVEFAPDPLVLPYVLPLMAFVLALVGTLLMPDPVTDRSRLRLTPQRPSVPSAIRRPFVLAAGAVLSSWSIGGLFLTLGPTLGVTVFESKNHLVTAIAPVLLAVTGAGAQVLFGYRPSWIGATGGSVALAVGVLLIVGAAATSSPTLFLAGAMIGGAGFGIAFLGGLRTLTVAIPPEHRASVMSAFYVVAYLSLSVPAVLAGVAATEFGLQETFEWFGTAVAALALLVAFEAWRTRPAAAQPGSSVSVSSDGCATG